MKTAGAGAAAAGLAGMAGKGLLGQMFPPGVQAAKKPPPEPKIPIDSAIVIGAGIAGLTAAYRLTQNAVVNSLTVIEQCHRPGGRVQTKHYANGQHGVVAFMESYDSDMDPETHGLWSELGFGGPDIAKWGGNQFMYWRGQYVPQTGNWASFINSLPFDDEEGAADFIASEDEIWEIEKGLLEWPLDTASTYPDYDDTDFEDWMLWTRGKKKVSPHWRSDVAELWDINLRSETGIECYQSSAAWGLLCCCFWDLSTNYYILKDGMYAMIEALMTNIPAGSVKLNETVSSVTNIAGPAVQVETNKGTYTADVAIVATPHNKVKGIVPELTTEKIASLDSMGNSKNFIAMQQYSERFWETVYGFTDNSWGGYSDHGDYGNYPTNKPDSFSIGNETCFQTGTTGILTTYINDPLASTLWDPTKMNGIHATGSLKTTITDIALDDIEQYWPLVRDYLISGSERVYCWDPYGPNYPVGHVLNGNYALNKVPVGRIYFVGDYIEDFGVGDAILSAQDVTDKFE
ncbi:MAG: FAD-dependent oxidoreductase [Candidatus Bathyarchaeota archaeon]|nr:MAG: FAD-dependent oxidoreductase [Candidatus Bathyarchaeota archaeon]